MKLAFDQQVFLLQEYGGISRYLCSLVRELSHKPSVEPHIFAPLHFNRNLESIDSALVSGIRLPKLPTKLFRLAMLASEALAHRAISRFKPDILHETYYSVADFCPNNTRRVLTVYDLIHERYPNLFVNSEGTIRPKKIAANRADHVICISESTRRDVIDFCGVPEEKTSVVYLGVDVDAFRPVEEECQYRPRPFLLYVGARGGYKNFDRLLRVYARSPRLHRELDLVCFGGGPLLANEHEMIAALGLSPDRVVQIGGTDAILATLYRQAEAFVYPSLYEGFGIPPLEAMAAHCPVVCSDGSSLPEVVGRAAETFDPLDDDAIQAAIEHVIESPERREELIAAGQSRHTCFSWSKCAEDTEAIYRALL
ncbi:glycosyltransferase family 4 protein [Propionivibrio dicarboxylicus]|uniref:Glycosyltransferase involved in cell wall bisynthesis n=1 Tax=Propionivibrio dicarboxylicus TaxID=83767 RepID=A0A1G8DZ17_9RHOO|nr:glycosyltransferase family 1 protein [Propionivibrio dicarboxylicus]SDH63006.1 Glycosyltransferase involved in cell wall bisynthesis [Propionivibrio dicarboxylicus]